VSLREPGTSRRSGYTPAEQVTGRGGIAGTGRRPDGLLGDENEDERGVLEEAGCACCCGRACPEAETGPTDRADHGEDARTTVGVAAALAERARDGEAELRVKETMAMNGARSAGEVEDVRDACRRGYGIVEVEPRPVELGWSSAGAEKMHA
jgi:hypothetical protein